MRIGGLIMAILGAAAAAAAVPLGLQLVSELTCDASGCQGGEIMPEGVALISIAAGLGAVAVAVGVPLLALGDSPQISVRSGRWVQPSDGAR